MSMFLNETNTLKNHKEKVGDIMTSLKSINRRVGSLFAVAALVLATLTPGLVPAFASAAQVTSRSVELSSSSAKATSVNYTINFTSVGAAGAIVFDFCSDSPLIGATCTAPTGFNVSAATVSGGDFVKGTGAANTNSSVFVTGTVAAATPISVVLSGITNPDNAGPLYVRMLTYTDGTGAAAYTSTAPGTYIDNGSAAASITDTVGVSAAVLESMTFCVTGSLVTGDNCKMADASPLTAPVLKLGEVVTGSVVALDSAHVSTGNIYSQISTNASNGAVVNLKSATSCGGLKRVEATACDIAPAGTTDITAGQAKFGVKVASAADPNSGTNSTGTYEIANASTTPYYSASIFKLNYVSGDASGITSAYGDPILDTNSAPVNNKNVQLTFGASAANNTPAGTYSTDLSLIATGKF